MQFLQLEQIHIHDQHDFGVGGGFGLDCVGRKLEVGRREHRRLRVVDVHVLDAGQVAHAARNGYVTLVFDGPRHRAVADAHVAVLCVGQEGNKKDFHALPGQKSAQFGEFDIVANDDTDFAAVGVEDPHLITAHHAVVAHFIGRDVNLAEFLARAIAAV